MLPGEENPTATRIYADVAQAMNDAADRHGAKMADVLVAANQIYASLISACADLADDRAAFIENMVEAMQERIEDVGAGRIPQLIRFTERKQS